MSAPSSREPVTSGAKRNYCRPECANPDFNECADCWRDGGNPALYPQKGATLPDSLVGFPDSDWNYYVPDTGNLADDFGAIGHPDEYVRERVWLRPVPASSLDWYDGSTTTRGADGKYEPVIVWIECHEGDRDAVPAWGARYAR